MDTPTITTCKSILVPESAISHKPQLYIPKGTELILVQVLDDRVICELDGRKIAVYNHEF